MSPSRSTPQVVTGIALIVLPLVALGLKFFSFGWLMVALLMGPIVLLLLGYALQIVIASQAFLSRKALFQSIAGLRRATAAAWISAVAFVVLAIFIPDGGDMQYGSTFQVWLGPDTFFVDSIAMHEATDGVTQSIAMIATVVWLVGFAWLVVEWIIGLVQRRKSRVR